MTTTRRKPVLAGTGLYLQLKATTTNDKREFILFPKGIDSVGNDASYGYAQRYVESVGSSRWSVHSGNLYRQPISYIKGYREITKEDMSNEDFAATDAAVEKANEQARIREGRAKPDSFTDETKPDDFTTGLTNGLKEMFIQALNIPYDYSKNEQPSRKKFGWEVVMLSAIDITDSELKQFASDERIADSLKNRIKKIQEAKQIEANKAQAVQA